MAWENNYGYDQFSTYSDPYEDVNDFRYTTDPGETIQMSTPVNARLRKRNSEQQSDVLRCEDTLLQIRENNNEIYNKFKTLLQEKEQPEGFVSNINKNPVLSLLIFIAVLVICLIFQIQNLNDNLCKISTLILLSNSNPANRQTI